eukprot:CAMPEP_0201484906 /NCGR_PEP_ID=MMETSP0151_2-20130828/9054_1 /ASSEMBLY_ACC=CAM_ASM_000257 /TAXON_ID=200890 /ORGANISM="Paramoeba atlantica, Strain 621/1 / CCAP 1560/9" /LENGTH=397 /DNA_ID=CAMNT_0047868781 /DNA_START=51 /DNA_END=1244 /DNA_ORIENTATION=+
MVTCKTCNVEVDGKFCGECGQKIEEEQAAPPATVSVPWCESCNLQMPEGKFCGECGSGLGQKEIEQKKKSAAYVGSFGDEQRKAAQAAASNPVKTIKNVPAKSSGYAGTFGDDQRKKAQAAASTTGGYNKFGGGAGTYAGGFGDEQRRKAQAAASTTGGYNKFGGSSSGYTGGFGDEQRKKAQAAASSTVKTIPPTPTTTTSTYVGTFGDDQRKKAQAAASGGGGFNKFGGQKPVAGGGMDFVTAHNVEKQKMVSESSRAKDNIVLSTAKKSEDAVDMATANAMKQQKETSSALKTKDKIVQSTEKKSEGVIDMATANAMSQQKETSSAMKFVPRGSEAPSGFSEALSHGQEAHVGGDAPQAQASPQAEEVFRCDSCNEERPKGKFCQECGTPLVQV